MKNGTPRRPQRSPSDSVGGPGAIGIPAGRRVLSLSLALCLLLALAVFLPGQMEVGAALPPSGDGAQGRPWDGIDFAALGGSGIYYGMYDHITVLDYTNPTLNTHEGAATPVLWRVMGEEGNSTHLTLLSEYILEAARFDSGSHVYKTSSMVNILSTMSGTIFQGKEPDYTEPVAVTTRMLDYWGGYDVFSYSGTTYPDVTTGQILYLMWGTAGNDRNVYWEAGASGNTAYRLASAEATPKGDTQEKPYWLRSPIPDHAFTTMGILYTSYDVGPTTNVTETLGIRPAFQLNPSSVIFASEILDDAIGKPWATEADGIHYLAAPGGDAPNYKLTIVDSGLTAGAVEVNGHTIASLPTIPAEPGDLVAVTANGATPGTRLTYKIVDRASGGIVGYGQGADNANLDLSPVNLAGNHLAPGSYTIYVWAQRNNSDSSHEGSRPLYFKLYVLSDSKDITGFAIPSQLGAADIDNTLGTITLTMPAETDPTSLTPTITHTGESVSPASGTAQDFTSPVQYTVTAQDHSTKDYLVTVRIASAPPPACAPSVSTNQLTIKTGESKSVTVFLGTGADAAGSATITSADVGIAEVTPVQLNQSGPVMVDGIAQGNTAISIGYSGGARHGETDTVHVRVNDSGSRSSPRNRSGGTLPNSREAKTRLAATAFSWDGERTLSIDHEGITPLGLLSVQWDGVTLTRGADYSVYSGSVILRFRETFLAAQSTGDHTVHVDFLNHDGETTVTVGAAALADTGWDNDTHNPNTGGDPTGNDP